MATCYVTTGHGSEAHNHDLEYRSDRLGYESNDSNVVEIIPYEDYKRCLNRKFEPFIDRYNIAQDRKYETDMARYDNGLLKNRPKRSNKKYKHMDYDYYDTVARKEYHNRMTGKAEHRRPFNSMIIGIKEENGERPLTQDERIDIYRHTISDMQHAHPEWLILGATYHGDEKGIGHMHVDYVPIAIDNERRKGLSISTSIDRVLEIEGYEAEKAIINSTDKQPLRYNAFRREMYDTIEKHLIEHDRVLTQGVTRNRSQVHGHTDLSAWQAEVDTFRTFENEKNRMLSGMMTTEERLEEPQTAYMAAQQLLQDFENNAKQSMGGKIKITANLYASAINVIRNLMAVISRYEARIMELTEVIDQQNREKQNVKKNIDLAKEKAMNKGISDDKISETKKEHLR